MCILITPIISHILRHYEKTMHKIKLMISLLAMLTVSLAVIGVAGCGRPAAEQRSGQQARQYTCPMHPEVVQDNPGNCPKCNMKLVEKQ